MHLLVNPSQTNWMYNTKLFVKTIIISLEHNIRCFRNYHILWQSYITLTKESLNHLNKIFNQTNQWWWHKRTYRSTFWSLYITQVHNSNAPNQVPSLQNTTPHPCQMAPPPPTQPQPTARSRLVRLIAIILLALIVLVGLAVLITWLAVRPRHLQYSIEDRSVHGFGLSHNHLNASFNFILRAHNPNTRVSIYYDKIEAVVTYKDQTVAFNTVAPFHQPRKNVTHLGVSLVAKDVGLFGDVGRQIRREKGTGQIEVEVNVKARIRFKVGVWKSSRRTLRIECEPVLVRLSSSNGFERTPCDVDLWIWMCVCFWNANFSIFSLLLLWIDHLILNLLVGVIILFLKKCWKF